MTENTDKIQKLDSSAKALATDGRVKWWETSEGHRFAGEVLQLKIRCDIMKLIGSGIKTKQEIKAAFGLKDPLVGFHLDLLEKADMITGVDGGYTSTAIGIAYLKNFEAFAKD